MELVPITHIFTGWDNIPNVSHLSAIEDSSVKAFENTHTNPEDIVYVSYILQDGKVVSFGSAGYFAGENYYGRKPRQLWIEGMVSTVKGGGRIILNALEEKLIQLADIRKVTHRIINVISVECSTGFYENNGYVECNTSSRFAGTGNIRLAKPIGDYGLESAQVRTNYNIEKNCVDWVCGFLAQGRQKTSCRYLNIPKEVAPTTLIEWVLEHRYDEGLFKDTVPHELRRGVIDAIIENTQ